MPRTPRGEEAPIRTNPERAKGRAVLVFLTFAALLLLAACGPGGGGQSGKSSGPPEGRSKGSGGEPAELGTPALGSADAPVVLTEYSDYQ